MSTEFTYLLFCLFIGIAIIVWLTTKHKVPAFFALTIAAFVVGLGMGIPVLQTMSIIKEGFGKMMESLALLIILGTVLGVLLEYTGSTQVMATFILKKVGEKRSALAMSITGFVVGLPIFCDSGYIVLSGLNNSITRRTGQSMAFMATSLGTGLYAIHCMIPPHPGSAAAAGILQVDIGKLVLFGTLIAIPTTLSGYFWSKYISKKISKPDTIEVAKAEGVGDAMHDSVLRAFLPIIVPIFLIAFRAFANSEQNAGFFQVIAIVGEPVIALSIGILLALTCVRNWRMETISSLLNSGVEKSGGILLIIGAGGAFGAVLKAINIGLHFSQSLPLEHLGILFPFLITAVVKTAQGSSTVAIITGASIVLPLLPTLGLDHENGPLLCVLAMGAGSMMISHANDAYFWVISKFSGLDMKTMLGTYSVATGIMGLVSFCLVYILSLIL